MPLNWKDRLFYLFLAYVFEGDMYDSLKLISGNRDIRTIFNKFNLKNGDKAIVVFKDKPTGVKLLEPIKIKFVHDYEIEENICKTAK